MRRRPPIVTARAAAPAERTFTAEEAAVIVEAKLAEHQAAADAELARQLAEVEAHAAAQRAELDAKLAALNAKIEADEATARADAEAAAEEERVREELAETARREAVEAEAKRRADAEREKLIAEAEERMRLRWHVVAAVSEALRHGGVLEERVDEAAALVLADCTLHKREPSGFYVERGSNCWTPETICDLVDDFVRDPERRDFLPTREAKRRAGPLAPPISHAERRLQDALERGEAPTAEMYFAVARERGHELFR